MMLALAIPIMLCIKTDGADAFEHRIQAGVGQYTIDYVEPFFSTSTKPLGGYVSWVGALNEFVAFDARLGGSGTETDASGLKLGAGGISVFFRPTLPVGEQFELYGLLGESSIAVDRSGPGMVQQTVARVGFSYGLGLDFRIADHFSFGAEWVKYIQDENYAATGVLPINISVTGISAQLAYHF